MKLPPLPLPDLNNSTGWERTDAQVIAYGKACYLAALEEAAKLLDELHAKDTLTNYHGFAANKVRALKGEIE